MNCKKRLKHILQDAVRCKHRVPLGIILLFSLTPLFALVDKMRQRSPSIRLCVYTQSLSFVNICYQMPYHVKSECVNLHF